MLKAIASKCPNWYVVFYMIYMSTCFLTLPKQMIVFFLKILLVWNKDFAEYHASYKLLCLQAGIPWPLIKDIWISHTMTGGFNFSFGTSCITFHLFPGFSSLQLIFNTVQSHSFVTIRIWLGCFSVQFRFVPIWYCNPGVALRRVLGSQTPPNPSWTPYFRNLYQLGGP